MPKGMELYTASACIFTNYFVRLTLAKSGAIVQAE